MNTPLKKFFEVVRLVLKIVLGANSERVMNIPSKKFFEAIWLFRMLFGVQNLTIIMSTPL